MSELLVTMVALHDAPLTGRRVQVDGLKARPELNWRFALAGQYNVAKGRYAVKVVKVKVRLFSCVGQPTTSSRRRGERPKS